MFINCMKGEISITEAPLIRTKKVSIGVFIRTSLSFLKGMLLHATVNQWSDVQAIGDLVSPEDYKKLCERYEPKKVETVTEGTITNMTSEALLQSISMQEQRLEVFSLKLRALMLESGYKGLKSDNVGELYVVVNNGDYLYVPDITIRET